MAQRDRRDGAEVPGAHEDLLSDLSAAQRQAVTSTASPLCLLAGAGTGKTRVLTRRIAFQVAAGRHSAEHTLALTFTARAAAELGQRLQTLGLRDQVVAGTFHAVASAQLRRWWADQGRRAPTLLTAPARIIEALAAGQAGLRGSAPADLAAELAWAQARLIPPDRFETEVAGQDRSSSAPPEEVATLYARYVEEKGRRGLVDFDDLLARCADAIGADVRFARAQHWRWRHIFVDEFQDLNPLQYRLLLAWMGESADLCVVGDPNQAVYGWNGADPGLLEALPSRWPSTEVVRLDENYRCTPQIVATGRSVLGSAESQLHSGRSDGPSPTIEGYPTEEDEAAGVAAGIRRAHATGLAWSRLAVLVRTNAQAGPLRQALEKAGIPCRTPSRGGLLDQPAAVEAIRDLRLRPGLPVATAVADLGIAARETAGHDAAVLTRLSELARTHHRMDFRATIGGFVAWLPSAAGRETSDVGDPDTVTISSFHRSKGLEWASVWLCGLERGLVPIAQARTSLGEAEERRLLYVAVTRAESELHCSWAARRNFAGRSVSRDPSPWLSVLGVPRAIPPASLNTDDVEVWRSVLVAQGRSLRNLDGRRLRGPGDLAMRLQAWRADVARGVGVPARVLLEDRSVDALATRQPVRADELEDIPGLGVVRAARFGPILLSLVAGGDGGGP